MTPTVDCAGCGKTLALADANYLKRCQPGGVCVSRPFCRGNEDCQTKARADVVSELRRLRESVQ